MGGELGGLGTTALEGDTGTVSEVRGQAAEGSERHRDQHLAGLCHACLGLLSSLTQENYSIDFLAFNLTAVEWKHSTVLYRFGKIFDHNYLKHCFQSARHTLFRLILKDYMSDPKM